MNIQVYITVSYGKEGAFFLYDTPFFSPGLRWMDKMARNCTSTLAAGVMVNYGTRTYTSTETRKKERKLQEPISLLPTLPTDHTAGCRDGKACPTTAMPCVNAVSTVTMNYIATSPYIHGYSTSTALSLPSFMFSTQ